MIITKQQSFARVGQQYSGPSTLIPVSQGQLVKFSLPPGVSVFMVKNLTTCEPLPSPFINFNGTELFANISATYAFNLASKGRVHFFALFPQVGEYYLVSSYRCTDALKATVIVSPSEKGVHFTQQNQLVYGPPLCSAVLNVPPSNFCAQQVDIARAACKFDAFQAWQNATHVDQVNRLVNFRLPSAWQCPRECRLQALRAVDLCGPAVKVCTCNNGSGLCKRGVFILNLLIWL